MRPPGLIPIIPMIQHNSLSEYSWVDVEFSHQELTVFNDGTLAEWLTRCPAKAIPSGACVRITQVSIDISFAFVQWLLNSSVDAVVLHDSCSVFLVAAHLWEGKKTNHDKDGSRLSHLVCEG
jgi:hypothetical protein